MWRWPCEPSDMRVMIAGAGVAGLTSAIALRQRGVDVLILERASSAQEIQVGGCIASAQWNAWTAADRG